MNTIICTFENISFISEILEYKLIKLFIDPKKKPLNDIHQGLSLLIKQERVFYVPLPTVSIINFFVYQKKNAMTFSSTTFTANSLCVRMINLEM